MKERLLYYAVLYKGDYFRITKALQSDEPYQKLAYKGNYICIVDEQYPIAYRNLTYPPYVLFYEGDVSLLQSKTISVVGKRKITTLGRTYCECLLQHIRCEYTIVSGFARGVDGYVHQLALANHKTIGILGCGIDVVYPKEHQVLHKVMAKHHLLLSEYPFGTKPFAYHFPMRNRLIAALSEKLVVVEADVRSGTLLTVNEALALNKEIYCFPHPFVEKYPSGCNLLIQEGALLLADITALKEL